MRAGKLFVGWRPLTMENIRDLGLDQMWHWEALFIQWRSRGITLCARPTKKRFS